MPEFQASHFFILKILQCRIFTAVLIGIANLFRNYLSYLYCNTYLYVCQLLRMFFVLYIVVWRKGNMWVYRYGEISYSSAVSEGTIHAIQGLYVNWREPILWLPALSVLSGICTICMHNWRKQHKKRRDPVSGCKKWAVI